MMEIQRESGDARIRNYWYRANQALKEKEERHWEEEIISILMMSYLNL
jgi:hypothetical protein